MDAFLNVYKPCGISSARAVAIVKRLTKAKKVGHAGTLDVEAEGVLPMLINKATKYAHIFFDARKEYVFDIKFGCQTDTADASGKIISETSMIPTREECIEVCPCFIGEIEQTPPAFSAIKVNGIPSYQLARKNEACHKLKARLVSIYRLNFLEYNELESTARYLVECSKGTYVRTLAEDIAIKMNSLGFVNFLQRVKVGVFTMQDAVRISDYGAMSNEDMADLLGRKSVALENFISSFSIGDKLPLQDA